MLSPLLDLTFPDPPSPQDTGVIVFFFQAEDGIRDPLWSRGLGDVYKRQNTGPGGTGGSGKVKSSKRDNTLREGIKGDPLHECCGNNSLKGGPKMGSNK